MKNPKILIAPVEIAGYYRNLSKAFKEINITCEYLTYSTHPFCYEGETKNPLLLRAVKHLESISHDKDKYSPLRIFLVAVRFTIITTWAILAIIKYDFFILGFGNSLAHPRGGNFDLSLLRLLGKSVISNLAHGSEARPPYIDGSYCAKYVEKFPKPSFFYCHSVSSSKKVKRFQKHSTFMIGAPFSTSHFATDKFINWFALGVPFYPPNLIDSPSNTIKPSHAIKILHSPSHPQAKGTPLILHAIQNLKNKGYEIDLVLLHGMQNDEIIKEIQNCDFVVDQIYSDTPMAGFATEAAYFGKPAVVGGYAFDYLKTFVPDGMWPPSKTCMPGEIENAIEDLIVNQEERLRIGEEAKRFVREKWNPAAVARRYGRLIEGDIPDDWWLDPNEVIYLHGAGQSEERTKENVKTMVTQFGVSSLQLGHRPDLERAFLEFADLPVRDLC